MPSFVTLLFNLYVGLYYGTLREREGGREGLKNGKFGVT